MLVRSVRTGGYPRFCMRVPCPSLFPTRSRWFHHSSRLFAPLVTFPLADIGEGIKEVEVLKWHVQTGEEVRKFDILCEVQSDKATVEITSPYKGSITKLHVGEGNMAQVGGPLVDFDLPGDKDTTTSTPKSTPVPTSSSPTPVNRVDSHSEDDSFHNRPLATPAVRRIARENDIKLETVPATGKGGRILKEDILQFLSQSVMSAPSSSTQAILSPKKEQDQLSSVGSSSSDLLKSFPPEPAREGDEVRPVRGLMRTMVKTMNAANMIPHFGYSDEIEMDAIMKLRDRLRTVMQRSYPDADFKLTYLPFILKAISLSLSQFPTLNAHTNPECTEVILRRSHNIGVAMDTPAGLLVPNVKDVQNRSIYEIAFELARLQRLGKEGKLGSEDLKHGTFSLSNIGAIGGTYAKPVLALPEVMIGAIGKIQRLPRFLSDESMEIRAAYIMQVSWSADHRVVDGATAARFSNCMKRYLENPEEMILDL